MIDVRKSRELQATLLAIKSAGSSLRSKIYADARERLGGAWLPALQQRASISLEKRMIIQGARTQIGTDGFKVLAATSTRPLRSARTAQWKFAPATDWPAAEFGASPHRSKYFRKSVLGSEHTVIRTVNRQFQSRSKTGRIAFDAASELGTKLVASFVVSVVGSFRDAAGDEQGV